VAGLEIEKGGDAALFFLSGTDDRASFAAGFNEAILNHSITYSPLLVLFLQCARRTE